MRAVTNVPRSYYREALAQLRHFRKTLRDPRTGLWGHARGWFDDPRAVTKVHWGRGQGWILRGLLETLTWLPPRSAEARQVRSWLRELAKSSLRYQNPDGMWRQVADGPDSYAETSATGLIVYCFARAVRQGYLPARPYEDAARRGWTALTRDFLRADGTVAGACQGTPPQKTLDDYFKRETPVNDPHGVAAVIFACSGRLLLAGKGRIPPVE